MKTPRFNKKFRTIIATKEMSAGNESVGSMWNETKSFSDDTPLSEVMEWGESASGKLILTYDESSEISKPN